MSDYRRAVFHGGVYFFTVVTHRRIPIFTNETRVAVLREAFRAVMLKRPFLIDAIVVLPDHIHCVWRLPECDADYSGRWREIKKHASARIDRRINDRGERPVWQRRFWEHLIRDEQDWRNHMDYVHYNPVKHGLVGRPGDWLWSSFRGAVAKGWYEPDWGSRPPRGIEGMDLE